METNCKVRYFVGKRKERRMAKDFVSHHQVKGFNDMSHQADSTVIIHYYTLEILKYANVHIKRPVSWFSISIILPQFNCSLRWPPEESTTG